MLCHYYQRVLLCELGEVDRDRVVTSPPPSIPRHYYDRVLISTCYVPSNKDESTKSLTTLTAMSTHAVLDRRDLHRHGNQQCLARSNVWALIGETEAPLIQNYPISIMLLLQDDVPRLRSLPAQCSFQLRFKASVPLRHQSSTSLIDKQVLVVEDVQEAKRVLDSRP